MKAANPGFFSIDDSHAVLSMPLGAAIEYAQGVIDKQTTARPETIRKAKTDISRAKNTTSLASTIINYMFKHPSEGLGVISPRRRF